MTTFSQVPMNATFVYDNERFVKTATGDRFDPQRPEGGLAWSLRENGTQYKEWAFHGDEVVTLA